MVEGRGAGMKHGSLCYDDEGKVECICGLADAAAAQAELEAEILCGCVPMPMEATYCLH